MGGFVNQPMHGFASTVAALRYCWLAMVLLSTPLGAQEIYIWTDENGIRNLSDTPPDGDYQVEVQRAIAEPREPVRMVNIGSPRAPEWQLSNRLHGPVTAEVRLTEADNTIAEPPLPARLLLPAQGKRSILLGALNPASGWRYRIRMRATPGPLLQDFNPNHVYQAPIPNKTEVRIGQGFGGQFSHRQIHSRYALDFSLPVGTPVRAARGGLIMDVQRWFQRSGQDLERDGPRANYVRILHADGSMAVYAHLDYNSLEVRAGERVETGEVLARSGNTGYSTGPHLHFAVQINRDMQLVSVPFVMHDHAGRALSAARRQAQAFK